MKWNLRQHAIPKTTWPGPSRRLSPSLAGYIAEENKANGFKRSWAGHRITTSFRYFGPGMRIYEEHLDCPFAPTVGEYQRGPVRQGARVERLDITVLES